MLAHRTGHLKPVLLLVVLEPQKLVGSRPAVRDVMVCLTRFFGVVRDGYKVVQRLALTGARPQHPQQPRRLSQSTKQAAAADLSGAVLNAWLDVGHHRSLSQA